jgi:hypothetical protein
MPLNVQLERLWLCEQRFGTYNGECEEYALGYIDHGIKVVFDFLDSRCRVAIFADFVEDGVTSAADIVISLMTR